MTRSGTRPRCVPLDWSGFPHDPGFFTDRSARRWASRHRINQHDLATWTGNGRRGRPFVEHQRCVRKKPAPGGHPAGEPGPTLGVFPGPFGGGRSRVFGAAEAHPLAAHAGAVRDLVCLNEPAVRDSHDADDGGRSRLFAVHGDRMGLPAERGSFWASVWAVATWWPSAVPWSASGGSWQATGRRRTLAGIGRPSPAASATAA